MTTLQFVQFYRLKIRSNYRQTYDESTVNAIATSIVKQGFKVEYPIPCYQEGDSFVIIDGHTRYHACLVVSQLRH